MNKTKKNQIISIPTAQKQIRVTKLDPETKFWQEVERTSKSLIADLIEKTLPISATPNVFDLERDTDYRVLLRDDLPNYYSELEDYQNKITNQTWNQDDIDYVSQDLTCAYFDLVVKSLGDWLSAYPTFENTKYLKQIEI